MALAHSFRPNQRTQEEGLSTIVLPFSTLPRNALLDWCAIQGSNL
jgi:hypothetical protein